LFYSLNLLLAGYAVCAVTSIKKTSDDIAKRRFEVTAYNSRVGETSAKCITGGWLKNKSAEKELVTGEAIVLVLKKGLTTSGRLVKADQRAAAAHDAFYIVEQQDVKKIEGQENGIHK
jgi:hypothetical protein